MTTWSSCPADDQTTWSSCPADDQTSWRPDSADELTELTATFRPLTFAEAQRRAELIEVLSYQIELDLAREDDSGFGSTTSIRFSCTEPGASTFVEVRPSRLVSATLNGSALEPGSLAGNHLPLDNLQPDNSLVVTADMPFSSTGEGMHRYVDPVDGETYVGAYLGTDNAQRVFAAFDQPDLKATLEVSATAPAQWTVISNGRSRARTLSDLTTRHDFVATPPLSAYLMVLLAGPWHTIETEHRGVPFALHCRQSLAPHLDAQADEIFAITRACFDRYLELFDEPYAFDSYDQAFVPELNWGAMESPGCVTFRDTFIHRSAVTDVERQRRGIVIAHEMAHMWFGDLVTMRWWDDLWLSESFAEYMGFQVLAEATRFTDTWTQFAVSTKTWGYDADQRPSTHPVAADAADVTDTERALANADGITYAKGASALRQLVTWLGKEPFLAGVNDFLTRHRFAAAALSDLLESLSAASGVDVHQWADQWLRTTGVDTLRLTPDERTGQLRMSGPGVRPHRIEVGMYDLTDGAPPLTLRRRQPVTLAAVGESDESEGLLRVGETRPDLLVLNDRDLSYCKVRPDLESWEAVVARLSSVPDALSRAVVWTMARDLTRDGELPPVDYLSLLEAHLPAEKDLAIAQAVLSFATSPVLDRYLDPSRRCDGLRLVADVCRELLDRSDVLAESTPGLSLVAARGLIDVAASQEDIGELRTWLQQGSLRGGMTLDPDLRWRILARLSALGAVGPNEIELEAAHDTSGGPEGSARCRAALPSLTAKEAAWRAMFEEPDDEPELSAYLVTATSEGFWQPEQSELLAPFVERYFAAAVDVASRRGAAVADAVGGSCFPRYAVDDSTLKAGQRCLDQGAPTAALRRALVDQLDDLGRALRVRTLHGRGDAATAQANSLTAQRVGG